MKLQSQKKKTTIIVIAAIIAAIVVALVIGVIVVSGISKNSEKEKARITRIDLSSTPSKTFYYVGDVFDPTGTTIQVITTDQSTTYFVNHDQLSFSGFDSETEGEKVITVTYNGFSTTFTVTVKEFSPPPSDPKVLTSIRLSDNFKTTYTLRKWNTSGPNFKDVYLICTFSDGSEESIPMSNNYIDPPNFRIDSPCTYELVLRYSIGGTEVTETVEITLTANN